MKNALYWLTVLLAIGVAGRALYTVYARSLPCAEPITYSIGVIDPRFDIATSSVLREAAAAAAIWNNAANATLLTYAPNGKVKINFVFDARQANADQGAQIARAQAAADAQRSDIEAERGSVTPANAESFNAQVAAYNAMIHALNQQIAAYNASAGGTFREGEYVSDASGKRIEIYEFVGELQLERVLAHELGHAIGLEHNANPASIMYAQNESGNAVPTADDLAALRALCGSKITLK